MSKPCNRRKSRIKVLAIIVISRFSCETTSFTHSATVRPSLSCSTDLGLHQSQLPTKSSLLDPCSAGDALVVNGSVGPVCTERVLLLTASTPHPPTPSWVWQSCHVRMPPPRLICHKAYVSTCLSEAQFTTQSRPNLSEA